MESFGKANSAFQTLKVWLKWDLAPSRLSFRIAIKHVDYTGVIQGQHIYYWFLIFFFYSSESWLPSMILFTYLFFSIMIILI